MRKSAHTGWILYVMIHVPYLVFCKIGITGVSIRGRAKQVDRAVFGFPVPVFFCIVPFGAKWIETALHDLMAGFSARFYRGDGSSEWFWFPAGIIAVLFCASVWVVQGLMFYLLYLKFAS